MKITNDLDDTGDSAQPQSALARGVRVLQCFSTAEPDLSGKDLIERTGLPKPTLFRILATLRELGLLRYSERRGKFMLAPGILALAAPVLSSMTIRQLARPLMQEMADFANGQVSLAVGDAGQFLYVELVQGRSSTVFRPEIGTSASLTRTASGRAYLTLLPSTEKEHLLARICREDSVKRQAIEEALEQTRHELSTSGFCMNTGELHRDTVGVAVPAPVPIDGELFVFGCSIPAYRLNATPDLLGELGMRLVALVHNVEIALGTTRN
jgi:DNA-binding IclR family transcriptional regulator